MSIGSGGIKSGLSHGEGVRTVSEFWQRSMVLARWNLPCYLSHCQHRVSTRREPASRISHSRFLDKHYWNVTLHFFGRCGESSMSSQVYILQRVRLVSTLVEVSKRIRVDQLEELLIMTAQDIHHSEMWRAKIKEKYFTTTAAIWRNQINSMTYSTPRADPSVPS